MSRLVLVIGVLLGSCLLGFGSADDGMVDIGASDAGSPISLRISQGGHVQMESMTGASGQPSKQSAIFQNFDLRSVIHEELLKKPVSPSVASEPLLRNHEEEQHPTDEGAPTLSSYFLKLVLATAVYLCYKHKTASPSSSKPTDLTIRGSVAFVFAAFRKFDPVRLYLVRRRERPSWLVRPNGQEINTTPEALRRLWEIAKEWRSPPPTVAPNTAFGAKIEDLLHDPSMIRVLAGFSEMEEAEDPNPVDAAMKQPEPAAQGQCAFSERSQTTNPFLEDGFPDLLQSAQPFLQPQSQTVMSPPTSSEYEQEICFHEYEQPDLL